MRIPKGSKDPNNEALGPKDYNINGIWALKPYYLKPWTLRVRKYENLRLPAHGKPSSASSAQDTTKHHHKTKKGLGFRVIWVVKPSRIRFQKEDIILLYIGYHSIPKLNTTHFCPFERWRGGYVGFLLSVAEGSRIPVNFL